MHVQSPRKAPEPVGYLVNLAGERTHAIIPLGDFQEGVLETSTETLLAVVRADAYPLRHARNPIREARMKANVTQDFLARALGISAAALSKQEQEGHVPRPATLDRALRKLEEISAAPR